LLTPSQNNLGLVSSPNHCRASAARDAARSARGGRARAYVDPLHTSPIGLIPVITVALALRWVTCTTGPEAITRHWPRTRTGPDVVQRLTGRRQHFWRTNVRNSEVASIAGDASCNPNVMIRGLGDGNGGVSGNPMV